MEKSKLCHALFMITAVVIMGPIHFLSAKPADVPSDWKSYIHPDMLREYLKTYGGDKFDSSAGFFEGDIVGSARRFSQSQLADFARTVNSDARIRWPGGIVPIVIHAAFRPEEAKIIKGATAAISRQSNGCITFVDRTNEADYMEFQKDLSSCHSPVGRQGGKQIASLSTDCLQNLGDIQHEIMHSLGFFHETSRFDRDDFVWINWENIAKENQDQFQMYTNGTTFGLPYDYESILHYPFTAFAVDTEKPTVIPKQKNIRIGQHKNLSPGDILKIKNAYKCDQQDVAPATQQSTIKAPVDLRSLRVRFFRSDKISREECAALDSENCFVSLRSKNCEQDYLTMNCSAAATNDEIMLVLEKIKRLDRDRPLGILLTGQSTLTIQLLSSVKENVIWLNLVDMGNFSMSALRNLELPNLLKLDINKQKDLQIIKGDLTTFPRLRDLIFSGSTFTSIEEGSFDSLPGLKRLSLEWKRGRKFTIPEREYLNKFHCDCQYKWLRTYFKDHPALLSEQKEKDIFYVNGMYNPAGTLKDVFVPVDCAKDNLVTCDCKKQPTFSVNDSC